MNDIDDLALEQILSNFGKKDTEGNDFSDEKFLNKMVSDNQGLVKSIAKKYFKYYDNDLTMDDLISEGNIGLIIAIRRFDSTVGTKFSTYAVFWIRQSILRAATQLGRRIRLPVHVVTKIIMIYKLKSKGYNPSDICQIMQISKKKYHELIYFSKNNNVIYESEYNILSDDNRFSINENHIVTNSYYYEKFDPEKIVTDKTMRKQILSMLKDELKKKEFKILMKRYGFSIQGVHTLQRIGKCFKISRERVRQIEQKAKIKIEKIENELRNIGYIF